MDTNISFKEFKEKYEDIRAEVYKEVPAVLNMPHVKITPINSLALAKYKCWPSVGRTPPNGGWDWASWVAHYRARHHKRIELAVWYSSVLCGLALGKMSEKNVHVRLEVLEGSTDHHHPLRGRVAYIALTAIEMFGYALGQMSLESLIPSTGL